MKVKVLFIDDSQRFNEYKKYLPLISQERNKRIESFHYEKDKKVSLFTELLIRKEVAKSLNIPFDKIQFTYNEYGKPFIKNYPKYHFSVSHCKNCIAFAESNNEIGIDVEQVSKGNLSIAKNFFTFNEYMYIINSNNIDLTFYQIWTAKEAYIKMIGKGLYIPLNSFNILDDSIKSKLNSSIIRTYAITTCDNTSYY